MKLRLLSSVFLTVYLAGCMPMPSASLIADPLVFRLPPRDAITFWGHATCCIDLDGVRMVTDPVLGEGYSPWHRRIIPAPDDSIFANTDIILISHAHRDHLHPKTVAKLPKRAIILCPEPVAGVIDNLDRQVNVMKPGDLYEFTGGSIIAVTAYHSGGRNSLELGMDGGAIGFIIRTPELTLYYSGDTDYFPEMWKIGRTYRPDLALLNISAHLNSINAVRAYCALDHPKVIPMHYGAYSGPSAGKSRLWLEEIREMLGPVFMPLRVGESYALR